MRPVIGYQIVHCEDDNPPPGMHDWEVYSLDYCLEWIDNNRGKTDLNLDWQCWRLCPIYEGDIEEYTFVEATTEGTS
jgi:hypothetical protein